METASLTIKPATYHVLRRQEKVVAISSTVSEKSSIYELAADSSDDSGGRTTPLTQ